MTWTDQDAGSSSFTATSRNLDLIRAVAVLFVFAAHLHDLLRGGHPLASWHFGQIGVLIFFVHTSMVLMLSLERTPERYHRVSGFYIRRVSRLYPLSILFVTLAFVLHHDATEWYRVRDWTGRNYIENLLLVTNLTLGPNMVGALWTLPIEMQMYVFLPFLYLFARTRSISVLAAVWIASMPVAYFQMAHLFRLSVLSYAPCFIAGVMAWKASTRTERVLPSWAFPIAFIAVLPVFLTAPKTNDMPYRWGFTFALAMLIPFFRDLPTSPFSTLTHRIAKYSYGIYLSHVMVMSFTIGLERSAGAWMLFAILMVAFPVALYHGVERPFIRIGHQLASRHQSGRC